MLENRTLEELVGLAREASLLADYDDRGVCVVLTFGERRFLTSREQAGTLLRSMLYAARPGFMAGDAALLTGDATPLPA